MLNLKSVIDHVTECPRVAAEDEIPLVLWAIAYLGLDLASEWEALSDWDRNWLVESGIVDTVEPSIEVTDSNDWQQDWQEDNGAAWCDYTLQITAAGLSQPIEVTGWNLVMSDKDGDWTEASDDGCYRGNPHLSADVGSDSQDTDRGGEWYLAGGEHMPDAGLIPVWQLDGRWVTLDRTGLDDALLAAGESADHGSEPTWEDLTYTDCREQVDSVYILDTDHNLTEIEIYRGTLADHRDNHDQVQSHCEAFCWSSDPEQAVYSDRDSLLADLRERHIAVGSEDHCLQSLGELLESERGSELGDPLEIGTDSEGLYLTDGSRIPATNGDQGEDSYQLDWDSWVETLENRYHLTAEEMAAVLRSGWPVLLDDLRASFGLRASLATAREWQEQADSYLAAHDPWVTLQDSLEGGNCQQVSQQVARELCEQLGGPVGAVRASVLLQHRSDSYSLRAARVAAWREMQASEYRDGLRLYGAQTESFLQS